MPPANNLFPPALTAAREAHTGGVPIVLASCPNLELGLAGVLLNLSGPPGIRTRPVRFRPGSITFFSTYRKLHTANVTQNPTVFEAQV